MRLGRIFSFSFLTLATAFSGQYVLAAEHLCPGSGSITLERWDGITINDPSQIPFSKLPNSSRTVTLAEAPINIGDNYGQRMRGYICAPISGNYTFFIAGDNQVKLYLSTDTNPANKKLIAYHNEWTSPREWSKFSTQKSAPVSLVGGNQYYIEALHVEGGGGDNLAVGWLMPTGSQEAPIPGKRLSTSVASTSSTSDSSGSGNLVLNSGFESGTSSWQNWKNSSVVNSNARSGSYSLRVGTGTGGRAQPINLSPVAGKTFTFKVSGKVSVSGEKGLAGVHFMKSGQQQTQDAQVEFTSTSYADKSVTFTVPSGIDAIRVWAWKDAGAGYLYLDDYSLVQSSSTTQPSPVPTSSPTATSSPVASCSSKGSLLLQRWDGISVYDPELLPVTRTPSASSNVTIAEAPSNIRDSYGHRLSGTICAPATGDYQFFVSGDDQTSLYLGTDADESSKRRIAYHTAWTHPREFEKYATQKSALIRLEAGKQYYIEARQVEQGGGDNVAIGWKLPNGSIEAPIPGSRLSPASGAAPTPTPTATATSAPSPTPTQTFTGDNPSPPVPAPNVTYSGPLVITKGGTYTGNWQSTNSEIPAVDVQTTEPVIIDKANIRGAGYLIRAWTSGANITVKNTRGYGLTPTPYQNYIKARRFLTVSNFRNVVVENNYMESTAGILVATNYVGNGTASETIRIRYNKAKNIDGRVYGGAKDNVQFFQVNFRGNVKFAEVGYNEVINEPGKSAVEDNINIYDSQGSPDSPLKIHNNYIQGAYPPDVNATKYTGGGIISDAPGDLNIATAHIEVFENHLVNLGNYSLGIAAGNNLNYHHNRVVNSGRFFGTNTVMPFYQSGMWANDYYKKGTTFNNRYDSNMCAVVWGVDYRHCGSQSSNATWTNNDYYPSGNPTIEHEKAEYPLYLNKLKGRGIFIGPRL